MVEPLQSRMSYKDCVFSSPELSIFILAIKLQVKSNLAVVHSFILA